MHEQRPDSTDEGTIQGNLVRGTRRVMALGVRRTEEWAWLWRQEAVRGLEARGYCCGARGGDLGFLKLF
ncbi:hypothetical protein ERO13_A09G081800v2 [Gossypium hirsutum]|nr:hypothetical protein ERO13_A09G081800v2 [Gossypium hirsutum]